MIQDLHSMLPVIIENIFGFGAASGASYGCFIGPHAYVTQSEFNVICDLLGPEGSLLRVVYKLAADTSCRYEFPISCLPVCCHVLFMWYVCTTLKCQHSICCVLVSFLPCITGRYCTRMAESIKLVFCTEATLRLSHIVL